MKRRDSFLFSLPLVAALLMVVFALFLYRQIANFEQSYLHEAKENIALEAELAAAVIAPMLEDNNLEVIARFSQTLQAHALRLTIIDDQGTVMADTADDTGIFDNHGNRQEVRSALRGVPSSAVRYSTSLNQTMIYHAMPLKCRGKTYVLRSAIPTAEVGRVLDMSRLNMFWALLFGAEIVLLLTFYIVKKVRRPLCRLQESVKDIADGQLERTIVIPEDGILRELALDIARMTEQLKQQLAQVTADRNEREVLFHTMSEGVLLFHDDGFLLRANQAAARLLGFDGEQPFQLHRCQIPELPEEAQRTFKTGEAFEREFCFERQEQQLSLWIRGTLLQTGGERQLLLTVTDLSKLRQLESFRADFIANVSHEIKTPLTCISGAAEALEETTSPENRAKLTAMLKRHAERLNHLVMDILNLSRLERLPRQEQQWQPLVLDDLVKNVVDMEQEHARECGIALTPGECLPLTVSGDADLLEQALLNLIENALRYSEGKTIVVSVTQEGAQAVLTVRDDGVGIAPEHHERLFERFYRVDKSRSRELGGTGLGLAIVKHIALLHRGRADINPRYVDGAEFRLFLPL